LLPPPQNYEGLRGRSPSVDRPTPASSSWGTTGGAGFPFHYSPGTPEEQGVEVPIGGSGGGLEEEFVPDTNVDRFLGIGKVDSFDNASAITGFTEAFSSASPPPPMMPPVVTPERIPPPPPSSRYFHQRGGSGGDCTSTVATGGDPGRILPKRRDAVPNRLKIAENTPFDEDIPFDEQSRRRNKRSSGAYGGGGGGRRAGTTIVADVPSMLDSAADDDEESDSVASAGSANSEQVLEDLDKLSKFMMERKRSSKSKRGMQSRTSSGGGGGGGGSTPGAVAFGGAGTGGAGRAGRKMSFGSRGI
jgi:hypothetical protein